MAEALLRHHLTAVGLPPPVARAGTLGWNSSGPTDHTLTALAERGVDPRRPHQPPYERGPLAPASLVIAMTNDHMDAVRNHHAEAASRTFVLGQLVRLGEKHGARGPRRSAVRRSGSTEVDAAAHHPRRRALPSEEIRDPLGEPLEAYQLLAAQLDDLTARLARLLAGDGPGAAPTTDFGTGRTAAIGVGQDGALELIDCSGAARGRTHTFTEQDVSDFQFAGYDIPWMLNHWATEKPDHPFLIWEPKDGEGQAPGPTASSPTDVRKLAAGLHARGIVKGDKVLIHSENCPRWC